MGNFTPTNLNEHNVNKVFKQCLATAQTQKPLPCVLFQKAKGFSQDSRPIFFDGDIIEAAKPALKYVLGQLKAVHLKESVIAPGSVNKTYLDNDWTSNKNLIIALLHLALAADLISPIDARTGTTTFLKELLPTLSTKDPNFDNWVKDNILTLEKMYSGGTKPADA